MSSNKKVIFCKKCVESNQRFLGSITHNDKKSERKTLISFNDEGIDELIFMDCVATLYGRNNLKNIIFDATKEIFIPITVGGGIRNLDDAKEIFNSGADKIAINSQAIKHPEFLTELAKIYGSQSIVVSVEAKKKGDRWKAYITNGRDQTEIDVCEWVKKVETLGAGEILLTSIDNEGTAKGLDLELCQKVNDICNIPIILSGGIGNLDHIKKVKKIINVDAIAVSHMIHYNLYKIGDVKKVISND